MNVITQDVSPLIQTLYQLLQENEENQTKITKIDKQNEQLTQNRTPTEKTKQISLAIEGIFLTCVGCNQRLKTPAIVGDCGHPVCLKCKKVVLQILDHNPPTLTEFLEKNRCPRCHYPASFKEVPIPALNDFVSFFFNEADSKVAHSAESQSRPDLEYFLVNSGGQVRLGQHCLDDIFMQMNPEERDEGFLIRFSHITYRFLKSFVDSAELLSDLSIIEDFSRQILLVKHLSPQPTKIQKTPKSVCVVDVTNNGVFRITHHPFDLTSKGLVLKETEEKARSIELNKKIDTFFGWRKFEINPQFSPLDIKDIQTLFYDFQKALGVKYSERRTKAIFDKLGSTLSSATFTDDSCFSIRVIHQFPRNYYVTDFMSTPPSFFQKYSGAGIELIIEGKAPKMNGVDSLEQGVSIQLLTVLGFNLSNNPKFIATYLKDPKPVKVIIPETNYIEFNGKTAILGTPNPRIPSHFYLGSKKVLLVTVQLLSKTLPIPYDITMDLQTRNLDGNNEEQPAANTSRSVNYYIHESKDFKAKITRHSKPKQPEKTPLETYSIPTLKAKAIEELKNERIKLKSKKESNVEMEDIKKELVEFLQTHFPSTKYPTILPPLDENYILPIPFSGIFTQFAPHSDLKDILEAMCSKKNGNSFSDMMIKHIQHFFSPFAEEKALYDLELYTHNPQLYRPSKEKISQLASPSTTTFSPLFSEGKQLVAQLFQRIEWAIHIQKKAGIRPDLNFCLKVVALDQDWGSKSQGFLKKWTELTKIVLEEKNRLKMEKFKALRNKSQEWPHAKSMLQVIENAGFEYDLSTLIPDHCSCKYCDKAMWGAVVQLTPWKFHDFSKHSPGFEELAKQGKAKGKQ